MNWILERVIDEFRFNNGDEKACGWCDYQFVCHEGVLGKNLNLEESA